MIHNVAAKQAVPEILGEMVEIKPLAHLDAAVRMPGSKSYTQRAMVLAALAEGESRLRDALIAEDTVLLAEALSALGAGIRREGTDLLVTGTAGKIGRPARAIQLGNNGTAMRLLAGVASLAQGAIDLTGGKRLCERPMKPLLDALRDLGVSSWTEDGLGYPPVRILGGGLKGGRAVLRNIGSSQYISALLIAAPFAASDVTLVLEGQIPSLPYVALTIETMGAFGVRVLEEGPARYVVPCGQRYRGREYRIEGDASSASYFFAAAALLAGRIRVEHIDASTRQGDIRFLEILERLGARIERGKDHVTVAGGRMPSGEMTFDMGAMPDMVPTLAVLAALRPGKTSIRNVAHLRLKESDRLAVLARELGKTGIEARELADGLTITGGRPQGAPIETYNDHRIAMAFAVLGLAVPGMAIAGEGCVGKSFPGFWETFKGLYRNDSSPDRGGSLQTNGNIPPAGGRGESIKERVA
jgi:3-phosphoshikimate 1-carboxyvinyltransferase